MENMTGRRGTGERANARPVYEDFQPMADWTNDSNSHGLLVDLPGFKKEELKVEVDNNGRLAVRGERQFSDNKYKRFKQVYNLPIDSDIDKITGKFDGGVLFVIIPKKETVIEEAPKEKHPVADGIAEQQKQETSKAEEKPKKGEAKQEATTAEEKSKKNGKEAEEHKQETFKTEEKPKKGEPKQETTTVEEKPKKDGKDTDVKHEHGKGIHEERKRVKNTKNEGNGGSNEGRREKEGKGFKFGYAQSAIEMITRNKGMVFAAILGLAVGMYLSNKLRSTDM
ncbi:inactive protein RESTRICTED TEV MOVEMENT 2-like [Telopea speciosissima]|uniref:inactive protein RESTRICTED TEV MOVEMENT 2-like n=1 Tax=Telopea speciosissima TaxID=54955 RepID=UPI001CC43190|nr:inactive protein RESTRICTED TEV MOVEMENT 2-like [Telopea speciosissima]